MKRVDHHEDFAERQPGLDASFAECLRQRGLVSNPEQAGLGQPRGDLVAITGIHDPIIAASSAGKKPNCAAGLVNVARVHAGREVLVAQTPKPPAQSPPYPLLGRGELYLDGRDAGAKRKESQLPAAGRYGAGSGLFAFKAQTAMAAIHQPIRGTQLPTQGGRSDLDCKTPELPFAAHNPR